ncbi:3-hydroxy-9,10-secoandrosta-1,3,5(10)-triene-9,17-dione monooxygenase reductase component [Catenulispora sp. MAP5-51]|uniref:flavin reductase family protein n=1 Tax=Catenulispora sp. MAP5-51 TaxID=3156298 RepID=UPI003515F01D
MPETVPPPRTGTAAAAGRAPDAESFLAVLSRLASGVVAVTGLADGGPVGLTVSSFVSVSLDPPLVSFCVARTSRTWPLLRTGGRVCVNILSQEQAVDAARFALRDADRFGGVRWRPSPAGLPVLDGGLAWLECTVQVEHGAGDHDIVVCRVDRLDEGAAESGPLVRFRGAYGRLERV